MKLRRADANTHQIEWDEAKRTDQGVCNANIRKKTHTRAHLWLFFLSHDYYLLIIYADDWWFLQTDTVFLRKRKKMKLKLKKWVSARILLSLHKQHWICAKLFGTFPVDTLNSWLGAVVMLTELKLERVTFFSRVFAQFYLISFAGVFFGCADFFLLLAYFILFFFLLFCVFFHFFGFFVFLRRFFFFFPIFTYFFRVFCVFFCCVFSGFFNLFQRRFRFLHFFYY